jgi:hypothetical protein
MTRAYAMVVAVLLSVGSTGPISLAQGQEGPGSASSVRLVSYQVVQLELRKSVQFRDLEGKAQNYSRAYLVTLKGTFPRNRGLGLELYIGDYRVTEYGGTHDGLYFRLYDPKLVTGLEGREFRYRFASKEIQSFGVRFSMKSAQPIRVVKEESSMR